MSMIKENGDFAPTLPDNPRFMQNLAYSNPAGEEFPIITYNNAILEYLSATVGNDDGTVPKDQNPLYLGIFR